jgi:hypothetical protein
MKRFAVVAVITLLVSFRGVAQGISVDSSTFASSVASLLNADKLKLGLVAQAGANIVDDSYDTQSEIGLLDVRFYVWGNLSRRFSYYSQFQVQSLAVGILDFRMTYSPIDDLLLDVGRFKIPFSREYLRSLNELTFIHASLVSRELGLGRDYGLQARYSTCDGGLRAMLAVVNGGSTSYRGGNHRPGKVSALAARVTATPLDTFRAFEGVRCDLGGSFSYADDQFDIPGLDYHAHKRLLEGDVRLQIDHVWIEWEGISYFISGKVLQSGIAASAGYFLSDKIEVAGRIDIVSSVEEIAREYTAAINFFPEHGVKCQANYVRDHTHSSNGGYLNFQYTINRD